MKKSIIFAFAVIISLLAAPFVHAETYAGIERFSDNAKLLFAGDDSKVGLALEIREKEIDSALENMNNENEEKALKNIEKAEKKLGLVQEKVSLETAENIKLSSEKIINKIEAGGANSEIFNEYILEEEKTILIAALTEKTFEYCKELAKEDFALMLKEEECNPDTAIPGLEEELKELKDIQIKLFVKLMLEIRSCIDDPGTCNCEANTDIEQKAKCEEMVALAIECEYKADETSCSELKAMEPKEGDSFAESFVPDFLMNLFREKSYMVGYDIEPSDGVPEECWDENDKPECEQYDHLKETNEDWDEYGNFIGKRPKNKEPTMQESIPQCFDENDNFLEEKCGKITIVRNEEGLVNYIIENEINGILEGFENKSGQNTIDVNGTEGRTIANEIKEEIDGIKDQIAVRTFAPGTSGVGEGIKDIKTVIVEGDKDGSDDGLKPEVKTDIGGGVGMDEPLPVPDLNQINPELYDPNARAPGDTIDEGVIDVETNIIEGGTGTGGVNEEPAPAVDSNEGDTVEGTNEVAPAVASNEGDNVLAP